MWLLVPPAVPPNGLEWNMHVYITYTQAIFYLGTTKLSCHNEGFRTLEGLRLSFTTIIARDQQTFLRSTHPFGDRNERWEGCDQLWACYMKLLLNMVKINQMTYLWTKNKNCRELPVTEDGISIWKAISFANIKPFCNLLMMESLWVSTQKGN